MIEEIDRLETEHQRRVVMLLEYGCGEQNCLETMRRARSNDTAEAAHRVTVFLRIVRKIVEPSLHGDGRVKPSNQPALGRREAL